MKKYVICLLLIALLLCACTVKPPTEGSAPTTEPTEISTPTTEATEPETSIPPTEATTPSTTPPSTAPTLPPHSDLYLPQYTLEQMLAFFKEVVLHVEYSDGTGDVTLVQKWLTPIYYQYYGTPTEEDRAVLASFFAQLNAVPGFPGIYPAQNPQQENLSLNFLNRTDFNNSFSDVVHGEDAFGATQFWYYTNTNDIFTARIGYRTDIDQTTRNSILLEEIVNTLGISDTILRQDSIVYQYSNDNLALSDVDWVILKLLYDPAIHCGMNEEQCREVILQRYY